MQGCSGQAQDFFKFWLQLILQCIRRSSLQVARTWVRTAVLPAAMQSHLPQGLGLHGSAQARQNKPSKHEALSKCEQAFWHGDLSELKNTRHALVDQTVQERTNLSESFLSLATSRCLLEGACCDCWKYCWSCFISAQE